MLNLSVVMISRNEERLIGDSLKSVFGWADEIIVVDDVSIDSTAEIARKYTDKVIIKKMDIEGSHRNWAYAQAKNNWILSLDADEIVTPELRKEIEIVLAGNPVENGFTMPRRNYIGNYWVRYGGWYPSPQLKLFKKDKFRFEDVEIHGRAFMEDPCGHLESDIIHYSYRDLNHFYGKLNRQTTMEARKWFRNNKPMRLGRFLWRAIDRFMRTYVGRKGYRDGFMGFVVAFNAALYQIISYLKYRELALNKKGL